MDKVILITGTSTGLGRTAAEALADKGCSPQDVTSRAAMLQPPGSYDHCRRKWNVLVLEMDVTYEASVNQAKRYSKQVLLPP